MRTLLLSTILLACACSHTTQLTSGAEYVAATRSIGKIDADIARIAAVEPDLRFPARIGVVRIVNGDISTPGVEEGEDFANMIGRHPEMGQFIPISPLVAGMVSDADPDRRHHQASTIADIRRAAARQHLDHVLIYEIGARSTEGNTPFALADATLIGGALLPTRRIRVAGVGHAILVDVRNGYPYGTAGASEDLSGLARSFGTERRADALIDRASAKVAKALVPEIEAMLVDLYRATNG